MFDLQPRLDGQLLRLSPLKPSDFEFLFEAARDPFIWEQHPDSQRYKREIFQKFFDSAIESQGAFLIRDRQSGEVIGSSRYYNHRPEKSEIMIGYTFLKRTYWGGKYNRELKQLMLDHAFQFVDTVLFEVGSKNMRSRKAMEKIGARFSYEFEKINLQGQKQPTMIFEMRKGN